MLYFYRLIMRVLYISLYMWQWQIMTYSCSCTSPCFCPRIGLLLAELLERRRARFEASDDDFFVWLLYVFWLLLLKYSIWPSGDSLFLLIWDRNDWRGPEIPTTLTKVMRSRPLCPLVRPRKRYLVRFPVSV